MTKFYIRQKKKDWECIKTVRASANFSGSKRVEIEGKEYKIEDINFLVKDDTIITQVYLG